MAVADPPAVNSAAESKPPPRDPDAPAPSADAATTDDHSSAAQPANKKGDTTVTAPDDEDVNPPDFHGEVLSNDELPSEETIRRIGDYIVLDRHGKTHTFKSLYTGRNVARRVLIIFVRHFFCGVSYAHPLHAAAPMSMP